MGTALKTTTRLDEAEVAFVERVKMPHTDEAVAMRALTEFVDLGHATATTLIHLLIEVGIRTVKEKAEEVGQERLTEFLRTDPEHQAWRNSRRRRGSFRSEEVA